MKTEDLLKFLQDPEAIKKIGIAPLPIRIGAIVILVAAILIGGYKYSIAPERQTIDRLIAEEAELKNKFEAQSRKAANLKAYQEQLDEMKRSFGSMLRQLPNTTEVESLLVDLSQTSAANSLKVDFFKPTGEVMKEFYSEYPIEMRVFGQYHELAKFVSDVAALPRIVTLHNITIVPGKEDKNAKKEGGGGGGGNDLTMEMIAKTYRYLDDNQ